MSIYVTGIPDAGDALEALADGVELKETDVLLCLGDMQLCDRSLLSIARMEALDGLGCEVAVMRGANEGRYWRDLVMDGTQDPSFGLWCGNWTLTVAGHPRIHFLPDAGGLFDLDGVVTLVLPSAMVGPDFSFYGPRPMLDLTLADRMWALTTELHACPPDLVVSYSQPDPSAAMPDGALMEEVREAGSIGSVPWLFAANADVMVPGCSQCPGGAISLVF